MDLVKYDLKNCLFLKILNFKRAYGVTLTFPPNGKTETEQVITFEAYIDFERSSDNPDTLILQYQKKDIRINHSSEANSVMELALKCSAAFYPLEIEINYFTNTFELLNSEEIFERWKEVRKTLDQYYTDENSKWYLDQTEKWFEADLMEKIIEQDIFLSVFLGLSYPIKNQEEKIIMDIPIMPGILPVEYSTIQKIAEEYTSYDTIVINRNGTPFDKRNTYDLLTDNNSTDNNPESSDLIGNLSIRYEIEKETHIIQSLIGNVILATGENDKKEIKFSAYHMGERDKDFIKEVLVEEKNQPKGILSFLKFLNN